jgi:hypothetical protein
MIPFIYPSFWRYSRRVFLNRYWIVLPVLILGKSYSSCLIELVCACSLSPLSSLSLFSFEFAPAFPTFRLAQRNAALVTVRREKTLLFDLTQHAVALYLFAKAFEQAILRLA